MDGWKTLFNHGNFVKFYLKNNNEKSDLPKSRACRITLKLVCKIFFLSVWLKKRLASVSRYILYNNYF